MIGLRSEDNVAILTLQSGENRFNRAFLDELNAALDRVESEGGTGALVTTGGEGKFYSNGLDLDWLMEQGQEQGEAFVREVFALLARMLSYSLPTVAAMNGHAFAGGGMLALAHDYRVMRADRGFFCLPEVNIHLPLAPGMVALIQSKLDIPTCRDLILTGRRIGGEEAARRGVVDEAVGADQVLPRAVALAGEQAGKDRATYAALKRGMYGDAIRILHEGRIASE
jgi:enoyl-CoA hydratase/carnithine racemase